MTTRLASACGSELSPRSVAAFHHSVISVLKSKMRLQSETSSPPWTGELLCQMCASPLQRESNLLMPMMVDLPSFSVQTIEPDRPYHALSSTHSWWSLAQLGCSIFVPKLTVLMSGIRKPDPGGLASSNFCRDIVR